MSGVEWDAILAYLSDTFPCINHLNLTVQQSINAFHLFIKINGFMKQKFFEWVMLIVSDKTDIFTNYFNVLNSSQLKIIIGQYYQSLNKFL